jgi:hypothetical protein
MMEIPGFIGYPGLDRFNSDNLVHSFIGPEKKGAGQPFIVPVEQGFR